MSPILKTVLILSTLVSAVFLTALFMYYHYTF